MLKYNFQFVDLLELGSVIELATLQLNKTRFITTQGFVDQKSKVHTFFYDLLCLLFTSTLAKS